MREVQNRAASAGTFEEILVGIDWARSRGAYGPSDGSVEHADVPHALRTIATGEDLDEDTYQDALGVLHSHVFHQGDVFDVTAAVVLCYFESSEIRPLGRRRISTSLTSWL